MVFSSRCNIGQSHNRRIVSNFFLEVAKFKHLVIKVTKWNEPRDEIKIYVIC